MNKDRKKGVYSGASITETAPHERNRHREPDPRAPGLTQGQHARLPERGDDRRHPESVSAMTIERDFDLYCTVKRKCTFYSRRY